MLLKVEAERMTIVEFLTARLRDDESYALEAAKEFGPDWIEIWSGQIDLSANLPERQPPDNRPWDAHVQTNDSRVSRYMVRHDPARVLREVAAKREVLSSYVAALAKVESRGEMPDGVKPTDLIAAAELGVLKIIVRDLASVYADHPDYEQAWAVE